MAKLRILVGLAFVLSTVATGVDLIGGGGDLMCRNCESEYY